MNCVLLSTMVCVVTLAGCSDSTSLTMPHAAANVAMKLTVPGKCIAGGCDPVSAEATALGLLTVTNTGLADAFLQACGASPAIQEQILIGDSWQFVGPAASCAFPSTPIRIGAGQTLRFNWFFGPGRRRLVESVGADAQLSHPELATSEGVLVF